MLNLLVFFSLIRTFETSSRKLTNVELNLLSFEKTQNSFGFLLTYSYLCGHDSEIRRYCDWWRTCWM